MEAVAGVGDVLGGAEGGAAGACLCFVGVVGVEACDVCACEGVVHCDLEGCGGGAAGVSELLRLLPSVVNGTTFHSGKGGN